MSTSSRFIILATQRTGSNYLQSLLNSHSAVYCAGELLLQPELVAQRLRERGASKADLNLLNALVEANKAIPAIQHYYHITGNFSENSIGFRFFYNHLGYWQRRKALRFFQQNDFRIIHLQRSNLLRRYLSLKIAQQSNKWASREQVKFEKVTLVPGKALKYIRRADAEVRRFQKALGNYPHHEVRYEELLDDPETSLRDIQEYLGLDFESLSSNYKRINDRTLRDSIENYDEVADTLRRSNWAGFLDE